MRTLRRLARPAAFVAGGAAAACYVAPVLLAREFPNHTGYEMVPAGKATPIRNYGSPLAAKISKSVRVYVADEPDMGPTLVRLAWHACGTYCAKDGTGGSNGGGIGTQEKNWGANAGLDQARKFVDRLNLEYPDVSKADLYVLVGVAAIKAMGGPEIPFRFGRKDFRRKCPVPDGRLPDADKKDDHIRAVFGRMGFNDEEMVALIGAHCLGRCHTDASGYDGPWSASPTKFDNSFFLNLLGQEWKQREWDGPLQYENDSGLMMLPADLALRDDAKFRAICEKFMDDEEAFTNAFRDAFLKLTELGVPAFKEYPSKEALETGFVADTYFNPADAPAGEHFTRVSDLRNVFVATLKSNGERVLVAEHADGQLYSFGGWDADEYNLAKLNPTADTFYRLGPFQEAVCGGVTKVNPAAKWADVFPGTWFRHRNFKRGYDRTGTPISVDDVTEVQDCIHPHWYSPAEEGGTGRPCPFSQTVPPKNAPHQFSKTVAAMETLSGPTGW